MLFAGLGPLSATASASDLQYYGGPVVHSANVVLVEWGADVRSSYTDSTSGDPGLFRYLGSQSGSTSDIGGVLAQYMDVSGHNSQNLLSFGGTVRVNPAVGGLPPATVQDTDLQSELASDITNRALPAPASGGLSTIYVVLFPPGDSVCLNGGCAYDANGGFCAYHGSFQLGGSATHVLYDAIVDDGPGTPNDGYCGPSSSDLANQTSIVSHEVAETINDPLIAEAPNWGPPLGWYDPTFDGEIADKCDAQPLSANGTWWVEPVWSNVDGQCEGGEPAYSAPRASFLGPSSGSTNQQLSFNAASSSDPAGDQASALQQGLGTTYTISSGITSYRWNWGDGTLATTSSSPSASHAFASAGTYQVSLTATDALGFTSTTTHQVSVTNIGSADPLPTTGAATGIDYQGATLNGTVNPENQAISYRFLYGTGPSSLTRSTSTRSGPQGQSATAVSATISGLARRTTYYYQLVVTAGNHRVPGRVRSFTTSASVPAGQSPLVATGSASRIGSSGALVAGTINPRGPSAITYAFSYGTSRTRLAHTTTPARVAGGIMASGVSASITHLRPATRYYFRLRVSFGGRLYFGAVRSFRTRRPTPSARTGSATAARSTSAIVSGSVNPRGFSSRYLVEFGPTQSYGYSTIPVPAGSGATARRVKILMSGLSPHTTYHYRLLAQGAGGTAVGADHTVTTAPAATRAPSFHLSIQRNVSLSQLLGRRLAVHFSCSKACTAHFVLIGVPVGIVRTAAVPLTIARTQCELRAAGTGARSLHLLPGSRGDARRSRRGTMKLMIVGYAESPRSVASTPQEARITVT